MIFKVVPNNVVSRNPKFLISVNGSTSIYPITFESEESALSFIEWLKKLEITIKDLKKHIADLNKFLNEINADIAHRFMQYFLEKIRLKEIHELASDHLNDLKDKLETLCKRKDVFVGGPKLRPSIKAR